MTGKALVVCLVAAGALCGAAAPKGATFTQKVTNPWFPLHPGARWVYRGVKDGKPSRDVVTVTRRTKMIDGAFCVVVSDRLYLRDRLEERTSDYYTQDSRGNVWYFGEDTAELDAHGHVTTTEGTWAAGVDGARPGVFMPRDPRVGEGGRQEYYKNHAEDRFRVIGRFGANSVLTEETTRLEPLVIDHKLYVRGVGTVLEQTERGGDERNELLSYAP